ncbi:proline-rich protein 2-like [Apus apus]|uniref:proline-rich protein 2-like n=1 Tax=Apus apus TaxID=8895 RepID=UPI0021F919D9|nr:proline-rich protein 2-like [Apus apus]
MEPAALRADPPPPATGPDRPAGPAQPGAGCAAPPSRPAAAGEGGGQRWGEGGGLHLRSGAASSPQGELLAGLTLPPRGGGPLPSSGPRPAPGLPPPPSGGPGWRASQGAAARATRRADPPLSSLSSPSLQPAGRQPRTEAASGAASPPPSPPAALRPTRRLAPLRPLPAPPRVGGPGAVTGGRTPQAPPRSRLLPRPLPGPSPQAVAPAPAPGRPALLSREAAAPPHRLRGAGDPCGPVRPGGCAHHPPGSAV